MRRNTGRHGRPPAARTEPTIWQEDGRTHIDLRGMEPPQPALAILKLLEIQPADGQVVAHLDRQPVFLYPELDERGWSWEIEKSEADEVRLRLSLSRPDQGGTGME